MNGRRTTVRECAQKNGKIDENSNEDKEEIDAKSLINGYIDDDVTEDEDEDSNSRFDAHSKSFESVDEVKIMGIERQAPASDVVESNAPKQTSSVLNTITVTAALHPPPEPKKRFQCFRFCRLVYTYQRQINSVSPGFLLLMATGFQILWGLNQLYDYRDGNIPPMIFAMVAIYYVGAIAGTILAAFLISIVRKRTIHVCTISGNSIVFLVFISCSLRLACAYRFFTAFYFHPIFFCRISAPASDC